MNQDRWEPAQLRYEWSCGLLGVRDEFGPPVVSDFMIVGSVLFDHLDLLERELRLGGSVRFPENLLSEGPVGRSLPLSGTRTTLCGLPGQVASCPSMNRSFSASLSPGG